MRRFNNEYDIQNFYDKVCREKSRIPVRVYWGEGTHFLGLCYDIGPYWIQFRNDLFQLERKHIKKQYTAFHALNISATDYVVYHEIFHHLSGLKDGENFEHQLKEFIEEQTSNHSSHLSCN